MHVDEGFLTLHEGMKLHYRAVGNGPETVLVPNGDYLLEDFRSLGGARRLIVYSPRNRGRSETLTDPTLLRGGIENDANDLEQVRRHFALDELQLIAHSYACLFAGRYAIANPSRVSRMVLIGPAPYSTEQYAADLTYDDGVLGSVLTRMQKVPPAAPGSDGIERCREVWKILSELYVTDPRNASRAEWGRCDQSNERNFMAYYTQYLIPSIRSSSPTAAQLASVDAATLVIHGRKDRSAPYGSGRDWARHLRQARLLTVPNGGHAPWIEDPGVLEAIETFLAGTWPAGVEQVSIP